MDVEVSLAHLERMKLMNMINNNSTASAKPDIAAFLPILAGIPRTWDGRRAVLEMKSEEGDWRQMEWAGFYAERLVRQRLLGTRFANPGRTYGKVTFDIGGGAIDWDVKTHVLNSCSSSGSILNDRESIDRSVAELGSIGLIMFELNAEFDDDGSFKAWHDELKGRRSDYEQRRIARGAPSRRRKVIVGVKSTRLIVLDATRLLELNSRMQSGMRNSNGKPRRAKYLISADQIARFTEDVVPSPEG